MQAGLHRTHPHGHTSANSRHDRRLRVRVTVRPGHMGQMLPDARLYASGTHEIEIYEGDLPQLDALLERDESELEAATKRHERLCAQLAARSLGGVGLQHPLAGLALGIEGFKRKGGHGAWESLGQ